MIPGFDDTLKNAVVPASPASAGGAPSAVEFAGIARPSTDMQAVRDGRRSTLQAYLVDLTNARSIAAGTALQLAIQGNVFMSDPLYDLTGSAQAGIARVHFQDVSVNGNAPGTYVTVLPTSVYRVPFTQVLVENYAQAGKFLYIVYGTDVDVVPGGSQQVQATIINLAQQSIGGVLAAVTTERGFAYGASFASVSSIAAGANEAILAPATNVNGVIVWAASIITGQGTAGASCVVGLLAKNAAPASGVDGDLLLGTSAFIVTAAGVGIGPVAVLTRPVFVAAGKGLYFRNSGSQGESAPQRSIQYTVL